MATIVMKREDTTADLIYRRYLTAADREERTYLGASVIGNECWRALWYGFRWAYERDPDEFSGRMLRLFDDGHREEVRIIDDLRAGGVFVFGEQTGFEALGGHLRGHIDGIAGGLPEAPKMPHVIEIKTHNDKSFKSLLKDGLKASKPAHYAQLMLYMHQLKYTRGIYIAVNKNDSSIYTERVGHEGVKFAQALLDKAKRIITADEAPPKLHENPDAPQAYVCGWCPAKTVCHEGFGARRNCRTCISATPLLEGSDGEWDCDYHDKKLTIGEQQAGCPSHRYLPSLVHGKQVDADEEKRLICYEMPNGILWTDRGPGSKPND
jgi:hypothetical protein